MFEVCKVSDAEMKEPCNLYKAFPVSEIVCFVLAGADEQGFVINCEDFGMLVMLNGCLYSPHILLCIRWYHASSMQLFLYIADSNNLVKNYFYTWQQSSCPRLQILDLSLGLIGEIQYLLFFSLHKIALKRIGMWFFFHICNASNDGLEFRETYII